MNEEKNESINQMVNEKNVKPTNKSDKYHMTMKSFIKQVNKNMRKIKLK